MVSYHLTLLVAYRSSASEDMTSSICHMNLKDHVIIESCGFSGWEFLMICNHCDQAGGQRNFDKEDLMLFISQVTL